MPLFVLKVCMNTHVHFTFFYYCINHFSPSCHHTHILSFKTKKWLLPYFYLVKLVIFLLLFVLHIKYLSTHLFFFKIVHAIHQINNDPPQSQNHVTDYHMQLKCLGSILICILYLWYCAIKLQFNKSSSLCCMYG